MTEITRTFHIIQSIRWANHSWIKWTHSWIKEAANHWLIIHIRFTICYFRDRSFHDFFWRHDTELDSNDFGNIVVFCSLCCFCHFQYYFLNKGLKSRNKPFQRSSYIPIIIFRLFSILIIKVFNLQWMNRSSLSSLSSSSLSSSIYQKKNWNENTHNTSM